MKRACLIFQKAHIAGLFCGVALLVAGCDRLAVLGQTHATPEDLPVFSTKDQTKLQDQDGNGVRDFVDVLILNSSTIETRKYWTRYAKLIQEASDIDGLADLSQFEKIQQNYVDALSCLQKQKNDDGLVTNLALNIQSLTLDFSERKQRWNEFQVALTSKSWELKNNPCVEKF